MRKFTIFILVLSNLFLLSDYITSQNPDIELLKRINRAAPDIKPISSFLSETAIPINFVIPAGIGGYGMIAGHKDLVKDAVYLVLASGVNYGMTEMLKHSIRRERPVNDFPNDISACKYKDSFSMPSGHTSSCFATATALSLKYRKWYVVVPSYAWAASVGFSRMHLGMHYPSDVLAGAALGVGSAYVTYKLNEWMWNNYDIRGWKILRKH